MLWPFVAETWGRIGDEAELLLDRLAAAVARRAWRAGRPPGQTRRRWRAQIDACIANAVADQILFSLRGLPGRPPAYSRPADVAWQELGTPSDNRPVLVR